MLPNASSKKLNNFANRQTRSLIAQFQEANFNPEAQNISQVNSLSIFLANIAQKHQAINLFPDQQYQEAQPLLLPLNQQMIWPAQKQQVHRSFKPFQEIRTILRLENSRKPSQSKFLKNCLKLKIASQYSETAFVSTEELCYALRYFSKQRNGIILENTTLWREILEGCGVMQDVQQELQCHDLCSSELIKKLVLGQSFADNTKYTDVINPTVSFALFLQQKCQIKMNQKKLGVLKNLVLNNIDYDFQKEQKPSLILEPSSLVKFMNTNNNGIRLIISKYFDDKLKILQKKLTIEDKAWLFYVDCLIQ